MAKNFYERNVICRDCGRNMRQTAYLPLNETGQDMAESQLQGFRHSHPKTHAPTLKLTPWVEWVDPMEAAQRRLSGGDGH